MTYDKNFLNFVVEIITTYKRRYRITVLDYGYLSSKYPTIKQFFTKEYGIDENTDKKPIDNCYSILSIFRLSIGRPLT